MDKTPFADVNAGVRGVTPLGKKNQITRANVFTGNRHTPRLQA